MQTTAKTAESMNSQTEAVSAVPPIVALVQSILKLRLLLGVMCLSFAWCLYAYSTDESEWREEQLRVLRMQEVQVARRLSLLNENTMRLAKIRAQPATVELLIIELVEAVRVFATDNSATLVRLQALPPVSGKPDRISMNIEIEFSRAQLLLALFDVIQFASDWRPIDIRGCSLVRLHSNEGVSTSCSVDVFLFPDLEVENVENFQKGNEF